MVNTPYKRTRSQIKKARTVIVLALVTVMLGIYLAWTHQAQPAAQAEVTATEALTQTPATPTPQPTQAKAVEEILPSRTPTIQATQVRLEPIDWVPLSATGVSIPTRYLLEEQCTQIPTGWTLFQPKTLLWEHCMEDDPDVILGDGLYLPAGVAVVPSGKIPADYHQQDAVAGQPLSNPAVLMEHWQNRAERFGIVRVCLLKDLDSVSDVTSYWLIIDEEFDLDPTSGGTCFTTVGDGYIQVSFYFLHQIYQEIKDGDFKYEVILDLTIQGGVDQDRWLGGKPLTNK